MKGLIYKDLALIASQGKFFIIYLLAFNVLFSFLGDGSGIGSFAVLICFMLSINCFAYDEQCRFDKLAAASPVPAGQVVLARYLSSMILGVFGCVLTVGIGSVLQLIRRQHAFFELLAALGVAVCLSLLFMTILFPLFYKFGVNKSRILMLIVCVLPAFAFPLLAEWFPGIWDFLEVPPALWSIWGWVAVAGLVLLLAASIALSRSIVRHKQY